MTEGDGRNGYPELAPYAAIHVGAAAAVTPQPLLDQLEKGGRMVVPVGPEGGEQYMMQVFLTIFHNINHSVFTLPLFLFSFSMTKSKTEQLKKPD